MSDPVTPDPLDDPPADPVTPDPLDDPPADPPGDGDTFPRSYVQELRSENGRYRHQARDAEKQVETLQRELFTERVKATGRVADAGAIEFDAAALQDAEALQAIIEDALQAKPYLKSRRVAGDIGQGEHGDNEGEVSLLGMLNRGT